MHKFDLLLVDSLQCHVTIDYEVLAGDRLNVRIIHISMVRINIIYNVRFYIIYKYINKI